MESLPLYCWLMLRRSLRLTGPLSRSPTEWLLLGVEGEIE